MTLDTSRVVIIRALPGLGDFLCAVPALRLLRQRLPRARVSLVGLEDTAYLVQRYRSYVDELIPFLGFPGIVERPPRVHALPDFLSAMQQRDFDLAIQMHGDGSFINIFTVLLGARRTIAFFLPPERPPGGIPGRFIPYPLHLHEIQRNLRLVQALGRKEGARAPLTDSPLPDAALEQIDFPLGDDADEAYARLAQRYGLIPGQYACIHAGAAAPSRRWPLASFAAVGRMLRRRGFQLILTGTAQEAPRNARLAQALTGAAGHEAPPLDLSGQTDLDSLALILRHARLLVCNDTGASHLAAAMQTPSVVISLSSEPHRWAPLNHRLHRTIQAANGDLPPVHCVAEAMETLLDVEREHHL